MGWRFQLKYSNTVAYVTIPALIEPPRMRRWELTEFLRCLQGQYGERPRLWSEDPNWVEELTRIARQAVERLETNAQSGADFLNPDVIVTALSDLKRIMSGFELYALAVGTHEHNRVLTSFCEHGALSSGHHGLFLIPDLPGPNDAFEMFDPLPVARKIAARPDLWPGILFWTPRGASAFAPLRDAYGLYQRMLEQLEPGGRTVDGVPVGPPGPEARFIGQDRHYGRSV